MAFRDYSTSTQVLEGACQAWVSAEFSDVNDLPVPLSKGSLLGVDDARRAELKGLFTWLPAKMQTEIFERIVHLLQGGRPATTGDVAAVRKLETLANNYADLFEQEQMDIAIENWRFNRAWVEEMEEHEVKTSSHYTQKKKSR